MNSSMSAVSKSDFTPFPFKDLPHLDSARQAVASRLSLAYQVAGSQKDILDELCHLLDEILHVNSVARVVGVISSTAESFHKNLPPEFLLLFFRLDPHPKKAFVLFDTSLAQLMAESALTNEKLKSQSLGSKAYRPITPLTEAIVIYVLTSLMEKISPTLKGKNFALRTDRFVRESRDFLSAYQPQDELVIFAVTLELAGQNFALTLGVPLPALDFLMPNAPLPGDVKRLEHFSDYKIPFELSLGQVRLSQTELDSLAVGDIVLLEGATLHKKQNRFCGTAVLAPSGLEVLRGYQVEFVETDDQLKATIKGIT